VSAPVDTLQLSLCHHVRSVFLQYASSVVQRGGSCKVQGWGCVVDEQDISIKTAVGVGIVFIWG